MEKYNLNEGNESLKRVLLMMGYDNNKTLAENTKNIFEQDMDNDVDPKLTNSLEQPASTPAPAPVDTQAPATSEVPLSHKDLVIKLQNLLKTKYNANLGKSGPNKDGVDGKIGKLTLNAITNAMRTKFVKQPTTPTDGENKSTTPGTKVNDKKIEIITPDNNVAVNPGSIDDWA
jgi:hypothetical protein